MATLARTEASGGVLDTSLSPLDASIPKPFPSRAERQILLQDELLEELANESVEFDTNVELEAGPSRSLEPSQRQDANYDVLHEVMPSIVYVQRSCLMTLNNLVSAQTKWSPIVPERRHSVPSAVAMPKPETSALQTLLSNLRNRESEGNEIIEIDTSLNNTELINELRPRIDGLASSLAPSDAQLARALVSLLSHFNRLSVIQSNEISSQSSDAGAASNEQSSPTTDVFDVLKRQLSDLQIERQSKANGVVPGSTPVLAVEISLLWSKIDEELEMVLSLCRERSETLPPRLSTSDHQPPQYNLPDYEYDDIPPEYEYGTRSSLESNDTKGRRSLQSAVSPVAASEKTRMDLEAVTMAIDRLYMVAPQLHNQRVELKTSKVKAMEKAAREGAQSSSIIAIREGKQREKDAEELEGILDLIGKAADRKMSGQSVLLEGGLEARLEKARERDVAKREAFVEHLANHSAAGRLHTQDAVLQPPKVKDLNAPMTLPEFLRESMAECLQQQKSADSEALLSLPEFVREPIPDHLTVKPINVTRLKKKSRNRSMSAPSLFWLRPSGSKSSNLSTVIKSRSRPNSSMGTESTTSLLNIHYVAEHHENLNHVLVFLTVPDLTPGTDIKAEVVPSLTNRTEGTHFIIHGGSNTSAELDLPVPTAPGKTDLTVQSSHFELKLSTNSTDATIPISDPIPLLDASQLSVSHPTSFTCASCSLPLVQSSKINSYRDLPSEHWEELVDAWMCHTDQNLHEQVAKRGRGFWPEPAQALIGGSYILFEESSVVKNNLYPAEQPKRGEDWRLVRCICGAVTGRCQNHQTEEGGSARVYRLVKYAIRPVSPTLEHSRIPLSAFVVEDMMEFVQAHATYRFVISDEEDERPRLLIWLFKPSIRLAYTTPKQYVLPKNGSVHAAKVLFKVLGPSSNLSDTKDILNRYPGFPQAEYLFYPFDICRRLASLLKESNTAYPESMRTMTGLDVGWLHRA